MASGSASDLPPGAVFAGHRIVGVAGRGGMGVVYRATDLDLERDVALKLIASELSEDVAFHDRFRRESRMAARIRHAHAVTVFRASEEDGQLFITMEFVDGPDLGKVIADEGRLESERATDLIGQVADALDAVHAAGLVHRDIKPGNVLVGDRGGREHAFLTDFGLSRPVTSDSGLTRTGLFVGTVSYAAPEQLRGEPVDARADVYALGCLLHHALVGKVPYPEDTPVAQIAAHLFKPPPSPREELSSVSPELDAVVQRATAKDPAERYPSAGDLGRGARAAARGGAIAEPERSVARGDAALVDKDPGATELESKSPVLPTELDRPGPAPTELETPPAPVPPFPQRPGGGDVGSGGGSKRTIWLAAGGAAALLAIVLTIVLVSSGGGDDQSQADGDTTSVEQDTTTTPATLDLNLVRPPIVAYMERLFNDEYKPDPICPATVTRAAGVSFDCTDTDGDGRKTTVRVTQTDDRGGNRFKLTRYDRPGTYIAEDIKKEYAADPDAFKVRSVTCPQTFDSAKLPRFDCRVTFVDNDVLPAHVKIESPGGNQNFDWSVPKQ